MRAKRAFICVPKASLRENLRDLREKFTFIKYRYMYKYVLSIIILTLTFESYSQKNVVILGKIINADNIPRTRALIVEDRENVKGNRDSIKLNTKIIYKSSNDKFFGIAEILTPEYENGVSDSNSDQYKNSFILMNDKGKILWKKGKDLTVTDCMISNSGKIINLLWCNQDEEETDLETYDVNGTELKIFKNIENFHKTDKGEVVYLTRTNEEFKWELVCYDANKNHYWHIASENYISILSISDDENSIIFSIGNTIFSYNSSGLKNWEKAIIPNGLFSLSGDGKYLSRMLDDGRIEIYSNKTGSLLLEKNELLINNVKFKSCYGGFVNNSEVIAICQNIKGQKSHLVFININGEILNEKIINNFYKIFPYFEMNSDKTISIFYDGIRVDLANL